MKKKIKNEFLQDYYTIRRKINCIEEDLEIIKGYFDADELTILGNMIEDIDDTLGHIEISWILAR